ncbi:MAG: hypothetical protein OEW67_04930 [Cyclobacteriaceae bacterium]|nr:hypothetical protein [Cyclobacteriaceae bacterium]
MDFIELDLALKVLPIIFLTMLKFAAGPIGCYAVGFPIWVSIIISIVGMMISVFLFTYLGDFIRDRIFGSYFKQTKTFSKRKRLMIKVWRKYGVYGVAFLTPVLFTPIPGTLVLVSFKTPNKIIFSSMLISAVFWSFIFTYIVYEIGEKVLPF